MAFCCCCVCCCFRCFCLPPGRMNGAKNCDLADRQTTESSEQEETLSDYLAFGTSPVAIMSERTVFSLCLCPLISCFLCSCLIFSRGLLITTFLPLCSAFDITFCPKSLPSWLHDVKPKLEHQLLQWSSVSNACLLGQGCKVSVSMHPHFSSRCSWIDSDSFS